MAKSRKPSKVVVEPYRARPIRGPHRDGAGRWYWRAELFKGQKGGAVTIWTGWATRDAVIERLRTFTGEQAPEDSVDPTVVTVADLMETWVASEEARQDVSVHWLRNVRRGAQRIKASIGEAPLRTVGQETLEQLRNRRLKEGAATATVRQDLKAFRSAWKWGQGCGVCPPVALPRVKLRVVPSRSKYTPDRAEALAALDALPGGWPSLVGALLFGTGCRIGEIATLTCADVDIRRRQIRVEGKTGSRLVPISTDLANLVAEWGIGEPGDLLCRVTPNMVRGHFGSRHLKAACIAAKVPHFSPHALRRAAVDAFLRSGVDVGTAAAHFGHSPQVMLQHYRQASLEDQRAAVESAGIGDLGGEPGKVLAFTGGKTSTRPAQRDGARQRKSPENRSSRGLSGTPKGSAR